MPRSTHPFVSLQDIDNSPSRKRSECSSLRVKEEEDGSEVVASLHGSKNRPAAASYTGTQGYEDNPRALRSTGAQ
ncbi:hypothetical protein VNI00_014508 [Paramarasmius palmivorus]|uniref:Uncharacterized protein n=1 Tax=Paramarasmius palmivorus TaxID=297713 RepID=A0AAW0BRJ3_9AGAR